MSESVLPSQPQKPHRILVVEDESLVAMDISQRLINMGFEIAGQAADGTTALKMAGNLRPDLVLMDIHLSDGMDGVEAARIIYQKHSLPVVFLTAFTEDTIMEQAKRANPFGYVVKPFEDHHLRFVIDLALFKHKAVEDIHRASRLYQLISKVNKAIARAATSNEVFQDVCRILTGNGPFQAAWITIIDEAQSTARVVACNACQPGLQKALSLSSEERVTFPISSQMASIALPAADSSLQWQKTALETGMSLWCKYPIHKNKRAIGFLNILAGTPDILNETEASLMENVTVDISFAIQKLDEEQQFKNLLAAMPDAVAKADRNGVIQFVSPSTSVVFGLSDPDEVIGTSVMHWIAPDHHEIAGMVLKQIFSTGQPGHINEYKLLRKNREVFWAEVLSTPCKNESGEIDGFLAIIRDITQRKQAESERLRISEMLTSSHNDIFAVDAQTLCFEYANAAMEQNLNMPLSELKQVSLRDLIPEASREPLETAIEILKRHIEPKVGFETFYRRADGSVYPVEIHLQLFAKQDTPLFLGVAEDITERRQAADKLMELQNRLSTMIEASPLAIILVDMKGIVVSWNHSAEQIFGWTAKEVIGKPVPFIELASNTPFLSSIALTGDPANSNGRELKHQARNGSTVEVCLWAEPIKNTSGETVSIMGMYADISERKKNDDIRTRLEKQLHQAQKMEALGTLAGGIAHDFNNILGTIIGNLELTRNELPPDHVTQDWLAEIHRASSRATDLIRQILSYSRQQDMRFNAIALPDIIRETQSMLRTQTPASATLQVNLPALCPPVLGDSTQIQQVLVNLCTNSFHALPPKGGIVRIALSRQAFTEEVACTQGNLPPGPYLAISVSDNGHGMEETTLKKVFDPFFTTKPVGQGTGLGLSVAHGIIKAHRGGINITSAPGRGTTVQILLPVLTKQNIPARQESSKPPPQGKGERILFVDDEESLGRVAKLLLQRLNYVVRMETSPVVALELFRANPGDFDLIITDLSMKGMDGIELARQILVQKPGMPILLATGFTKEIQSETLNAIGIRELLLKPITAQSLAESVHRALHPPNSSL